MSKELIKRLFISVIGIPVLLYIFYFDGMLLLLFMGLISLLGMWEFNKILANSSLIIRISDLLTAISIYITVTHFFDLSNLSIILSLAFLTILICLRILTWCYGKNKNLKVKDYLLTIIGWIYTGFFPALIYLLGSSNQNQKILILLIILIWITDSAAYFIGMRFGKHRGIFAVSPNKSLEGFIAGIIVPIIASGIIVVLFKYWTWDIVLLAALCAGFFGQIGDLFESKIKRTGGVKDSSNIIPGHGGVLDRFDSLLIAGPVLYLLIITIS